MTYAFSRLCGKGKRTGLIRREGNMIRLQCSSLPPGESCTLYCDRNPIETKAASTQGTLCFDCTQDGFFFLCSKAGTLLLWEEGENSAESHCRALSLRPQKSSPPNPPIAPPSPPAHAPALPEKEESSLPFPLSESDRITPPAREETPFQLRQRPPAPPAFSLPTLQWPKDDLPASFLSGTPFLPFSAPGFRCVRLPSPHPAIPYCLFGFRTENSRVSALLYALPGHPLHPPRGFTPAQYRDGHFIRTQAL